MAPLSASNNNTLTLNGGLTLASGSTRPRPSTLTGTASANPLVATSGGSGGNSFVVNGTDAISVTGNSRGRHLRSVQLHQRHGAHGQQLHAVPAAPAGSYYAPQHYFSSQVDLTVTNTLTWTGNNTTSWDTSTPNNWAANATAETYTDTSNVVFNDTNATGGRNTQRNGRRAIGRRRAAASVIFNNTSTPVTGVAYTINSTGSTSGINGSTGIMLNGTATVTLLGTNTYSGTTALNAGTLVIGNNNSLGGGAAPLTFNGGSLQYAPGLTSNSISSDISGRAVTFASGGATIDINGNNVAFANPIGNSGSGGLTLINSAGPATLTLAAANTYGGGTNVNSGTLRVSNTSISGSATGSGSVAVSRALRWPAVAARPRALFRQRQHRGRRHDRPERRRRSAGCRQSRNAHRRQPDPQQRRHVVPTQLSIRGRSVAAGFDYRFQCFDASPPPPAQVRSSSTFIPSATPVISCCHLACIL